MRTKMKKVFLVTVGTGFDTVRVKAQNAEQAVQHLLDETDFGMDVFDLNTSLGAYYEGHIGAEDIASITEGDYWDYEA